MMAVTPARTGRCADGTRFWSHVTIERVIDARERIVGFIVIIRDMTRAREDQERLSETRAHLDTALDNMYQGLALFDASQRLVLHNDRLCELWSLKEGVLRPGMTIAEIVLVMMARAHVDDPGRTRTALESAMSPVAAGTTVIECRADFIVSVATRPLVQGDGCRRSRTSPNVAATRPGSFILPCTIR
jgi:transcriptional regulator with PAS, ATPase and Fis domain